MALPAVIPDPIGVYRGDPFTLPLHFWSDTDKTVPVDLTGYGSSFLAQARTGTRSTADVVFTVDATDAATGTLTLSLTADETAAMAAAAYGFDVQGYTGDVPGLTFIAGSLTVSGDYSRPDA